MTAYLEDTRLAIGERRADVTDRYHKGEAVLSRSISTIERLAFRLQQLPGVGAAKLRKILASIRVHGESAEDFVALDEQTLIASHGLSPAATKQLACPSPAEDDIWDKLVAQGVKLLVQGWDGYPQRLTTMLGDTAPPILYVRGATELLTAPGVGFCGSRKASDKGLGVAGECARLLSAEHINIVSGYAHCGLSNALVVIESGLEGGTFEAAKTALALKEPLFCVEYANPAESAAGNSWLLEHGGIRLRRGRSGQPNLAGIVEAICHQPTAPARVGHLQGDLLQHSRAH